MEKYRLTTNFKLLEPQGYLGMIYLLQNCKAVITDSGGLQKEAFFFDKFCLTLRDTTEWTELIDHGANKLLRIDSALTNNILELVETKLEPGANLYGNGDTSKMIVSTLLDY